MTVYEWWPTDKSLISAIFQVICGILSIVVYTGIMSIYTLMYSLDTLGIRSRNIMDSPVYLVYAPLLYVVTGIFGLIATRERSSWSVAVFLGLCGVSAIIGAVVSITITAIFLHDDLNDLSAYENSDAASETVSIMRLVVGFNILYIVLHAAFLITSLTSLLLACYVPGGCLGRPIKVQPALTRVFTVGYPTTLYYPPQIIYRYNPHLIDSYNLYRSVRNPAASYF